MTDKLQQIHYARNTMPRFEDADKPRRDAIVERRRQEAVTNMQLRTLQRLVNRIDRATYKSMLLRHIDTTEADWQKLVEMLNVAE